MGSAGKQTRKTGVSWTETEWWNLSELKFTHTPHLWHDWFSFRGFQPHDCLPRMSSRRPQDNVDSLGLFPHCHELWHVQQLARRWIWKRNFLSIKRMEKKEYNYTTNWKGSILWVLLDWPLSFAICYERAFWDFFFVTLMEDMIRFVQAGKQTSFNHPCLAFCLIWYFNIFFTELMVYPY